VRASTTIGNVGRSLSRQVSRNESIRSTQRSPFSFRDHASVESPTCRTLSLVENEMGNLHLDFRKFDMLVRVVRSLMGKFMVSANTFLGRYRHHLGGLKKVLLVALMSFDCSRFALALRFPLCFLVGHIRRRRAIGVLRVLSKLRQQFLYLSLQQLDQVKLNDDELLHSRRSLPPISFRDLT
jgi:hypothetical protein